MQTSEQPLVSAVIPTYNRAELISRAIDSVLKQSYTNLEIIVVDDCSQDSTPEVVNKIQDSRLYYYRHSTNQGGSAARNTGIKQSQGQYIAFLDSDDVWLPQKLDMQLEAIAKQTDNLERVVCYTRFQKSSRVFYQPSILPRRGKKTTETIADYFWLGGGEILTSTLLVSRSLAVACPFQVDLPKHQDLDFVLRLADRAAEFIFLPQVLTIWHNEARGDRVSRRSNYQLSLDWIASYRSKISERAYKGFILKEVVPKMLLDKDPKSTLLDKDPKSTAIELLIEGFRQGIISLDYFLFLIIKQAVSQQHQQSLKRFLQKINIIPKPE